MYRNTYVEINLGNIKKNVRNIINTCNNYDYYFGVVKADCYGHYTNKVVKSIIDGGCNYLCVATLDEALEIREELLDIPILVLGIVPLKYIDECIKNNVTISISNTSYVDELVKLNTNGLKCHIKINTGMNRLGLSNISDIKYVYDLLINNNILIEGCFSHIYNAMDKDSTAKQIKLFYELSKDINCKIKHLFASDSMLLYDKLDFINGCRLGISMYGLCEVDNNLLDTYKLVSEVIQINDDCSGTLGYNGTYNIKEGDRIAVIPIGYADGFIRKNKGSYVYINDRKYEIVGNICMDMLFILVDSNVNVHDKVYLIKDNEHLKYRSHYLDTIPYEIICGISKRVPRVYIEG